MDDGAACGDKRGDATNTHWEGKRREEHTRKQQTNTPHRHHHTHPLSTVCVDTAMHRHLPLLLLVFLCWSPLLASCQVYQADAQMTAGLGLNVLSPKALAGKLPFMQA